MSLRRLPPWPCDWGLHRPGRTAAIYFRRLVQHDWQQDVFAYLQANPEHPTTTNPPTPSETMTTRTLCIEHLVASIEEALDSTRIEVGIRGDVRDDQRCTVDMRHWVEDSDLIETMDLEMALAEDDVEDGTEMDLYIFTPWELRGNATLTLHDGTFTLTAG